MSLVTINQPRTMTSREIAELVGTSHDSVLKTVRSLIERGVVSGNETPYTHPQNGQTYTQFALNYRDTMVVASGYSVEMRARIIDRWQELEAQAAPAPAFAVPQTYAQALLEAGRLAAVVEQQQAQLEAAKPAVAFVDRFVEAKSSKCLSDVAKLLGWKPQAFIAKLSDDGVIFKRGGSWVPTQGHIDAGRFTVKTGEASGHAYQQTRVTPNGVAWLAKRMQAVATPEPATEGQGA